MNNSNYAALLLAAGIAFSLLSGQAQAQLEEVIVTAQKREENVQSIPIAVTALSEATIRNANMLYLDDVARKYDAHLSMHLNPTFAGKGTPLAHAFQDGEFVPPTLQHLARAALHGEGKGVPIFLGLNDEGLAVEGGSFRRPGDEPVVARLERFNQRQDYDVLRAVAGAG